MVVLLKVIKEKTAKVIHTIELKKIFLPYLIYVNKYQANNNDVVKYSLELCLLKRAKTSVFFF